MNETQTAFLILRAPALLSENKVERDRLLNEISRRLGVEDECDLATITNLAAEGTDTAARFPVSQDGLRDAIRPIWTSRMGELFLIPRSSYERDRGKEEKDHSARPRRRDRALYLDQRGPTPQKDGGCRKHPAPQTATQEMRPAVA